eukprot:s1930_g21.t1
MRLQVCRSNEVAISWAEESRGCTPPAAQFQGIGRCKSTSQRPYWLRKATCRIQQAIPGGSGPVLFRFPRACLTMEFAATDD